MTNRPSDPPPPASEADEATMMIQVPDEGIRALRDEFSSENLRSMQNVLARCEVEHIAPGSALEGFNFRGMVRNLRGIGKVEVGELKLFALLTRNNAFLLSNLVAAELHDHIKGFMDLNLGDRAILSDGGKRRFLYKVPSAHVEMLRTIANQNRYITAVGFPFRDLEQFKRRLASCTVSEVPGEGGGFDVEGFAERVKSVSNLYEDGHSNQYHRLVVGEMEYPYLLFVRLQTNIPDAIMLYFETTPLALVRD
jgi:hypothetical protein